MEVIKVSNLSSRKPPYDFYEMELLGDSHFTVAVPIDAEEDLKRKVLGAVKTHLLGQKSVDYILKRFGPHWSFPPPDKEINFLIRTLRAVDDTVARIINIISSGEDKREHVGLFAAEMALIRLKPTFRSIHLLIMQGYSFEAATLCRLILEQYGFAYATYKINDPDKILKIKPSKTITNLKKLLPYSGKFYGDLSSKAHLTPKDTRYYIGSKDGAIFVRYQLHDDAKIMLYYFVRLAIAFKDIANEISGKYVNIEGSGENSYLEEKNNEILNDAIEKLEAEFF